MKARRRRLSLIVVGTVVLVVGMVGLGIGVYGSWQQVQPGQTDIDPTTRAGRFVTPGGDRDPKVARESASPDSTPVRPTREPTKTATPTKKPSESPEPSDTPDPAETTTEQPDPPKTTEPPEKEPSPTPEPEPTTPPQEPSPPPPPDDPPEQQEFAAEVVRLTNAERADAGCDPLRNDSRLHAAAQKHSVDMGKNDYFSHTSADGRSPWDRMRAEGYDFPSAENIARGQQTPAAVVESWMDSPGHRRNILNCSYAAIGVGVYLGDGGPWWTQDFGYR